MSAPNRARDIAILAVVIIVVGGGIAGFGFYHDEVTSYIRLQGWNLGPVKEGTQQFLAAASKGDGEALTKFLGPESGDLRPVRKNGKLVSFLVPDYGGPVDRTLKSLAPKPEAKLTDPKMVVLDGGAVTIEAQYPSHKLELRWNRLAGAWKVIKLDYVKTK